jgi:diketogulonate reductase-like aldo/keto reductase
MVEMDLSPSSICPNFQLWNNSHRPELVAADLEVSLKQLGTDYLDLWLIVSLERDKGKVSLQSTWLIAIAPLNVVALARPFRSG